MKTLFAVLCILVVSLLHSSQGTSDEGCYYQPENRTLATGEKFTIEGQCVLGTCTRDGTVVELECGLMRAPCDNPRVEQGDLTKPYPDCCFKLHCD